MSGRVVTSRLEAMILTPDLPTRAELLALYASVGWTTYADDPDALERAVRQSSLVVCGRSDDGDLLGLVRVVSDDVSIVYVQDLLVAPAVQRRGVGRALMEAVLARYAHVRQRVLITGDEPGPLAFYRPLGLHNTRELTRNVTNCFYGDARHELS